MAATHETIKVFREGKEPLIHHQRLHLPLNPWWVIETLAFSEEERAEMWISSSAESEGFLYDAQSYSYALNSLRRSYFLVQRENEELESRNFTLAAHGAEQHKRIQDLERENSALRRLHRGNDSDGES